MSIVLFWLLATVGIPPLMLLWIEPHWQLSGTQRVMPAWLHNLYSLALQQRQQLISPALYFALMLMGLIATMMPALDGMNRIPVKNAEQARSLCANS